MSDTHSQIPIIIPRRCNRTAGGYYNIICQLAPTIVVSFNEIEFHQFVATERSKFPFSIFLETASW